MVASFAVVGCGVRVCVGVGVVLWMNGFAGLLIGKVVVRLIERL